LTKRPPPKTFFDGLPGRHFGIFFVERSQNKLTDEPILPLAASPNIPTSSGSSHPEGPTLAAKIQELLDHIRALDNSMDHARLEKIARIKKTLADGTYHVSADDVARKILSDMQEP
jgi:anti-sigma28 factor (negative regulator of flagellin synthesis)